jgi:hypothetical protein
MILLLRIIRAIFGVIGVLLIFIIKVLIASEEFLESQVILSIGICVICFFII